MEKEINNATVKIVQLIILIIGTILIAIPLKIDGFNAILLSFGIYLVTMGWSWLYE